MNRPGSSRRMSGGPPGAPPTAKPPGTATRLATGMQRPTTKGANMPNQSVVINPTKAEDKPMSRGGLGGFQTNTGGFNRQVQDKTYYLGILRSKVTEIYNEINRMNRDIGEINGDNANYQAYGRKAEELAQQIEDSMAELLDYNTLIDRLNISSNEQDIKKDYSNLKTQNDAQGQVLDELFIEKSKKEDAIKKLEKEMLEEKRRREKLLTSLSGPLRSKYEKIKAESDGLQEASENIHSQIEKYKDKIDSLKDQVSASSLKQEALALLEQLHECEIKKEQLIEETRNSLTPAEEREVLLKQVKENNQEISVIEKQVNELKENIDSIKREIEEDNDEPVDIENQREDMKKYRELKKREVQMDEFLENFDETKRNEEEQLASTRRNIVGLLELVSKGVAKGSKNGDNDDSQYASVKLADLQKVEQLEVQVKNELQKLKEKQAKMEEELVVFSDLDGLKRKSEARKQQLQVEKQNLGRYRENIKYEIETLLQQVQAIEAQLTDNETHNQLSNLEKKLQIIEQNNFTLRENISSVTAETDYEHLKSQVISLVEEHNKWLQEDLLKPKYDYDNY